MRVFWCSIICFFLIFNEARSLRDVTVQVPPTVSRGAAVTLRCIYDLEGDSLYMLKWYRGKEEFYRYVPKELPPTRVFPLPGFDVDVGSSDASQVVLRAVTLKMSGRYRCEVSADAPTFHTAMVARWMHVVEFPEGRPEIISEKRRYAVGDTLRANCTTAKSTPPANVTWWLNGQRMNETWSRLVKHVEKSTAQPGNDVVLEDETEEELHEEKPHREDEIRSGAVRSSLESELGPASFRDGKLHVRCEASLFGAARDAAEMILEEERPRLASVLGTRESHPSPPSAAAAAGQGSVRMSTNVSFFLIVSSTLLTSVSLCRS